MQKRFKTAKGSLHEGAFKTEPFLRDLINRDYNFFKMKNKPDFYKQYESLNVEEFKYLTKF